MRRGRIRFPVVGSIFLLLGLILLAASGRSADHEGDASVVGVITFDGPRPERKTIQMIPVKGESPDECSKLHKTPVMYENAMVSEQGELANVFVYVKHGLDMKSYPLPTEPAVLDQKKCMFVPHVQGIQVGQEFLMRNSDQMVHNVRSYSFRNRAFNIAQPANTPDRKKVFTKPERAVKLKCDIHRWMTAYVFAMDHPFFAVSNEKGHFEIKGLPAGEYTLAAWHEEFGEQEAKITVGATGSSEVGFAFREKAN